MSGEVTRLKGRPFQPGHPKYGGKKKGCVELATRLKKQIFQAGLDGKAAKKCKELIESDDIRKVEVGLRFIGSLVPRDMSLSGVEGAPIILEVAAIQKPPESGTGGEIEE